jgi:hypothetical protein
LPVMVPRDVKRNAALRARSTPPALRPRAGDDGPTSNSAAGSNSNSVDEFDSAGMQEASSEAYSHRDRVQEVVRHDPRSREESGEDALPTLIHRISHLTARIATSGRSAVKSGPASSAAETHSLKRWPCAPDRLIDVGYFARHIGEYRSFHSIMWGDPVNTMEFARARARGKAEFLAIRTHAAASGCSPGPRQRSAPLPARGRIP